ncbi:hypothetical protein [Nonomuraea sp. NPDC049709]|uniref:hypothetical protein n=1 Tax=Nonomuraea sp. NPDC049709 TaxID=3154736 RepID=UPI003420AE32
MGRYASVDWIQFEWDERRTGLGPVRSSLEDTRGWYHQLGPWLDPGPAAGVSVCRLLVDGRVVVLARTRTGGSDSRRTIRVQAYLGGSADRSPAMPNVRQALALAPGWAEQLPADDQPLDLARLLDSYTRSSTALDRRARAGAGTLAPIVAEALRRPGKELSVASRGDAVAQLWGLVDILDLVLGRHPETFSTYESDDLTQGAEVIFLQQWPGPSSRASHRARVDLRAPYQEDEYGEIAARVVDAYARDELVELVRRLRFTDSTPPEERIRLLASTPPEPVGWAAAPSEDSWAPRPPARASGQAGQPSVAGEAGQPSVARAAGEAGQAPAPAPRAASASPYPAAQASQPGPPQPQEPRAQAARTLAARAQAQSGAGAGQAERGRAPGGREPQAGRREPRAGDREPRAGAAQSFPQESGQGEPLAGTPAAHAQAAAPGARAGGGPQGEGAARTYAMRDVFEEFRADLAAATSAKEVQEILKDVRAWAATRQPSEVRSRLPALVPELERVLPDSQINPVLRDLLDPDAAPATRDRSGRLDRRWLVLVVALSLIIVLQVVTLILR